MNFRCDQMATTATNFVLYYPPNVVVHCSICEIRNNKIQFPKFHQISYFIAG